MNRERAVQGEERREMGEVGKMMDRFEVAMGWRAVVGRWKLMEGVIGRLCMTVIFL